MRDEKLFDEKLFIDRGSVESMESFDYEGHYYDVNLFLKWQQVLIRLRETHPNPFTLESRKSTGGGAMNAAQSLFAANKFFLGDVVQMTKKELLSLEGCGRQSVLFIERVLDAYGFSFGMEVPNFVEARSSFFKYYNWGKTLAVHDVRGMTFWREVVSCPCGRDEGKGLFEYKNHAVTGDPELVSRPENLVQDKDGSLLCKECFKEHKTRIIAEEFYLRRSL